MLSNITEAAVVLAPILLLRQTMAIPKLSHLAVAEAQVHMKQEQLLDKQQLPTTEAAVVLAPILLLRQTMAIPKLSHLAVAEAQVHMKQEEQ